MREEIAERAPGEAFAALLSTSEDARASFFGVVGVRGVRRDVPERVLGEVLAALPAMLLEDVVAKPLAISLFSGDDRARPLAAACSCSMKSSPAPSRPRKK